MTSVLLIDLNVHWMSLSGMFWLLLVTSLSV